MMKIANCQRVSVIVTIKTTRYMKNARYIKIKLIQEIKINRP